MAVAAPVDTPTPQQHKFPQEAHGFVLEREQFVQEYDSNVALYKHKKTGMIADGLRLGGCPSLPFNQLPLLEWRHSPHFYFYRAS